MRINVTYSQAIDFTDRAFKRMSRQTTVKGLFAEVRAFANYMLNLQKQSPIVVQWHYEDVQGMDVRGYPQLEKMQRQLLSEMLARADAAGPAYYTSSPVGKPFQQRIERRSAAVRYLHADCKADKPKERSESVQERQQDHTKIVRR